MPAETRPRSSLGQSAGDADFVDANPATRCERVAAVFADLSKAFDERPADVKAAVAKLFPDLDQTLDLCFDASRWPGTLKPLRQRDMAPRSPS